MNIGILKKNIRHFPPKYTASPFSVCWYLLTQSVLFLFFNSKNSIRIEKIQNFTTFSTPNHLRSGKNKARDILKSTK